MKIHLKKPLIVFDLETTGINVTQDRIIEISYIKIHPNGNEESKMMRINPERHIPEATTKIHGHRRRCEGLSDLQRGGTRLGQHV